MKFVSYGFMFLILLVQPAFADDLVQVYQRALNSDPVFAEAQSTWESAKMNLPIARASYLTQVGVTGYGKRNYNKSEPALFSNVNGRTWQYGYGLTVTQPIFNLATWAAISGANANVKAATATYFSAQQSLMKRTTQAYFNVLQAYDQLRYTIANKRAVWQQLVTAQQKFQVGLIAITDVYDARSQYDQVIAAQIAAQNGLNIQLENLRAITNRHYSSLDGLGKRLPLLKPQPANIDQWVVVANQQNYALKAQNYAVTAAMQNVKKQSDADYPSVNAVGGVNESHVTETPNNAAGVPAHTSNLAANIGLSLSYQPIQGGSVTASTKQARYDYATASSKLEEIHRNVVNQTRSSYLSVMSGISQIQADKQRIMSARNALSATEAGFKVGTRTMVDVLNGMTTLYQAQQQYADDQYAYINHIIDLKAAAGTLSVADLQQINSWLTQKVQLSEQTISADQLKPEAITVTQAPSKKKAHVHSTAHLQPPVDFQATRNAPRLPDPAST